MPARARHPHPGWGAVPAALGADATRRPAAKGSRVRANRRYAASLVGIDEQALGERDLPLLAAQPALRLVEQPLRLAMLARDARDRDPRPLPDVVVVDLDTDAPTRFCS